MAKKGINESIGAGATVDVLENWNYQTPPKAGVIQLLAWAPATGLFMQLQSLDQTIYQDSPVGAGATANTYPSNLNVSPITEKVPGGQKLSLLVRNPTAGAIVFLAVIDYVQGSGR